MAASRLCRCGQRIPGGRAPRTCPSCTKRDRRKRAAARPGLHTRQAAASNAALVSEHRARYGDWCPGIPQLKVAAHPAADLTADHVPPVTLTGDELGPRVVRCRSCNSRLGGALGAAITNSKRKETP